MKVLEKNELLKVSGGSLSGTLLSSFIRGIGLIVEIGRGIGTAIRRLNEHKLCKL